MKDLDQGTVLYQIQWNPTQWSFFLSPNKKLASPVRGEIFNFTRPVCGSRGATLTCPAFVICVCLKKVRQRPVRKGQPDGKFADPLTLFPEKSRQNIDATTTSVREGCIKRDYLHQATDNLARSFMFGNLSLFWSIHVRSFFLLNRSERKMPFSEWALPPWHANFTNQPLTRLTENRKANVASSAGLIILHKQHLIAGTITIAKSPPLASKTPIKAKWKRQPLSLKVHPYSIWVYRLWCLISFRHTTLCNQCYGKIRQISNCTQYW